MIMRNSTLTLLLTMIAFMFHVEINAQERKVPMAEQCSVDCMKEKALNGDSAAARNLALVYGKVDFKSMQYWNLIGAENGDSVSQYNYAFWLLEKGGPKHRGRAIFWLKKSASSGDKEAIDLLSRVKND